MASKLDLLGDISAEDFAYMDLRFFSEHCWRDIAGQVANGEFQNEWYRMLQKDDRPRRLHIQAAREHAKTTCLSVKYPLWRVGRNPDLRVMIVSKSATLTSTIIREIRQNIEGNKRLQTVFPGLVPDMPWGNDELQVKRSLDVILKDATFVGVGLHGGLTGKRADLIIVDDPFDEAEVRTEAQRKKVEDWIEKLLIPTLTPNGEIVFVGTPWHYDDYWSHLETKSTDKGGIYMVKKYPAIKKPEVPVEEWEVLWPAVWSAERLAERKKEIGSIKFNCLYLLDPSGFEGALFKSEWLTYFDPRMFNEAYVRDFEYYLGVDPNVSDNPDSSRMALVTIAFDRLRGDIFILDVYAEPMDFPNQMKKILMYARRRTMPFIPGERRIRKVGIEANTWQQAVSKAAYVELLPVVEIKQKQTKVERMLGLQPHFESGRIKLPDPNKINTNWMDKFMDEYLSFPHGKYKDILDGLEIAFELVNVKRKSAVAFGPGD